jgi:heavy metal sensor kinase
MIGAFERWWRGRSVRLKLTVSYMSAMVVVLVVYAGCLLWALQRSASQSLDERLRGDFRWAAEMAEQRPDGTLTWFETTSSDDEDLPWLQVWTPGGQLLFKTAAVQRLPIVESGTLAAHADNSIEVVRRRVPIRVLSGPSHVGGKPVVIQVARSEAVMRQNVQDLLFMLLVSLPVAVAVAGVGGYSLARRALAPVERIAERARSVTADRIGERVAADNPTDELGRLTGVINDMLERLESSFTQMRRFTSDVSHELRTPLTAIRSVGEVALRSSHTADELRGVVGSMLEESDRLAILVDRLLMLSRAELGHAKLSIEPLDLRELAEQVVAHLSVLAEEKGQALQLEPGAPVRCQGDPAVLRQALVNLVDNAIKYTPPGGHIRLRAAAGPREAVLEIADSGPGIEPATAAHVFDRFYRGRSDAERASDTGVGLGLAIAKWAVEVNGGRLTVESRPGHGSTFRLSLSATAPAA